VLTCFSLSSVSTKNTIIFLPWVANHSHVTGKEEVDILTKTVIFITGTTEREISYCQNHNLIEFEDDDRPTDVQ
jgi:hypothetical protein